MHATPEVNSWTNSVYDLFVLLLYGSVTRSAQVKGEKEEQELEFFAPRFTYHAFGTDETIQGYDGLQISVLFNALDFSALLDVKYKEQELRYEPNKCAHLYCDSYTMLDSLLTFYCVHYVRAEPTKAQTTSSQRSRRRCLRGSRGIAQRLQRICASQSSSSRRWVSSCTRTHSRSTAASATLRSTKRRSMATTPRRRCTRRCKPWRSGSSKVRSDYRSWWQDWYQS